jgi:hypothetical protein
MDYAGFITYCFTQGINPEIIRACKTKVMQDDYVFTKWGNKEGRILPTATLGYAELRDIDTVEKGIKQIKESIRMSIDDYDTMGRSKEKVLVKRLIKNPHKGLIRCVLKTYYLLNGTAI